mmetsp:Transcript_18970/g.26435  ORF Transcript_18970/g.26435 Transcript_18970/m.26435 type:complete len:98 (+) Transcript_18970:1344-1637(+)
MVVPSAAEVTVGTLHRAHTPRLGAMGAMEASISASGMEQRVKCTASPFPKSFRGIVEKPKNSKTSPAFSDGGHAHASCTNGGACHVDRMGSSRRALM